MEMAYDGHDEDHIDNAELNKVVALAFRNFNPDEGVTKAQMTRYLAYKLGEDLMNDEVTGKIQEALERGVNLGFLEQKGRRYISSMFREAKRRRKKSKKRRRRR